MGEKSDSIHFLILQNALQSQAKNQEWWAPSEFLMCVAEMQVCWPWWAVFGDTVAESWITSEEAETWTSTLGGVWGHPEKDSIQQATRVPRN